MRVYEAKDSLLRHFRLIALVHRTFAVGVTLYRADAAAWLAKELIERKWVGELMVISS